MTHPFWILLACTPVKKKTTNEGINLNIKIFEFKDINKPLNGQAFPLYMTSHFIGTGNSATNVQNFCTSVTSIQHKHFYYYCNLIYSYHEYLMMSLKEAHNKFVESDPDAKISLGKFCELRPERVKLFDHIHHYVCACSYHENARLLLISLKEHAQTVHC